MMGIKRRWELTLNFCLFLHPSSTSSLLHCQKWSCQTRDGIPFNGSHTACREKFKELNVAFETSLTIWSHPVCPAILSEMRRWESRRKKEVWNCHSGKCARLSVRAAPYNQGMIPMAGQQECRRVRSQDADCSLGKEWQRDGGALWNWTHHTGGRPTGFWVGE